MPRFCAVVGCGHRGDRDKKSFFRLPAAIRRGTKLRVELSYIRKMKWIIALRRADLTERKIKWMWVCEDHFISGKPAELYNLHNPDWVPSINMGYNNGINTKASSQKQKNDETNDFIQELCDSQKTLITSENHMVSSICATTEPLILSVQPAKEPIILSICSASRNNVLDDT